MQMVYELQLNMHVFAKGAGRHLSQVSKHVEHVNGKINVVHVMPNLLMDSHIYMIVNNSQMKSHYKIN